MWPRRRRATMRGERFATLFVKELTSCLQRQHGVCRSFLVIEDDSPVRVEPGYREL